MDTGNINKMIKEGGDAIMKATLLSLIKEIDGIKRSDAELNDGENKIARDNYFFNLAITDILSIISSKI